MKVHCVVVLFACAASGAGCLGSSGSGNPDASGQPGIDGGISSGFDAGDSQGFDSGTQAPPGDGSSGDGGLATPCTLAWTGQVSAMSVCRASGSWDTGTSQGNITLSVTDMSVTSGIGLDLSAAPAVGNYTLGSLAVGTNVSVTVTGGDTWSAEKPSTTYQQGSIMLTVTAVTPTTNVAGTQLYDVHGSLTSVLGPTTTINFVDGSAAGMVTSMGMVNLMGTF
jgi:hypothetical protein